MPGLIVGIEGGALIRACGVRLCQIRLIQIFELGPETINDKGRGGVRVVAELNAVHPICYGCAGQTDAGRDSGVDRIDGRECGNALPQASPESIIPVLDRSDQCLPENANNAIAPTPKSRTIGLMDPVEPSKALVVPPTAPVFGL